MRRAVVLVLVTAARASAAPAPSWRTTAEAGTEVDSNVERVETGPGLPDPPQPAPVFRFGVRTEHRARLAGGGYALGLSDLTRIVGNQLSSQDLSVENVTLLAGDWRWLHPIGERPVSAGVAITAVDAFGLTDPIGARTFRILGADGLVTIHSGDERHLALAFGGRAFTYKPDHSFDWTGPAASARLDLVLWQPAGHTRSLELATTLGFEARAYDANALVNACPPGAPADPKCTAPTDLLRRDRYQRAGVELTWVGKSVASLGYQLTVIDSNSYGQSLARHRVMASATTTIGSTYATLLAILQIDQYLDGLVIDSNLMHTQFTNIEDEDRSSLQLRIARKLSAAWSIEGRAAVWRNLARSSMQLAFQRDLVYAGVIYTR